MLINKNLSGYQTWHMNEETFLWGLTSVICSFILASSSDSEASFWTILCNTLAYSRSWGKKTLFLTQSTFEVYKVNDYWLQWKLKNSGSLISFALHLIVFSHAKQDIIWAVCLVYYFFNKFFISCRKRKVTSTGSIKSNVSIFLIHWT